MSDLTHARVLLLIGIREEHMITCSLMDPSLERNKERNERPEGPLYPGSWS